MSVRVALWTDYQAAGGTRLGSLPVIEGDEATTLRGTDLTALVVPRARWLALGGDVRHVVRVEWPTGEIVERRIARLPRTPDTAPGVALECLPVFDELTTGGEILRVVGGRVATRVAGELPVSVALSTYVLPHPAAQRLGLVLGTIESDIVVQFDLDSPTPAALILDLFGKAKLEVEIVRTSDTVWTLHGRKRRGSTAPVLRIREGRNQAALALGIDDAQLATVVVPLGDADPATGDRATIATARWRVANIAAGWVQLRDPADASVSPIRVDTQWQGAWLTDGASVAQAILSSRVSDGAVQLASTAGLEVGQRVTVSATADGAPLVEVYDGAVTASRRRVVSLRLAGVRGEANEVRNARFVDGLDQWAVVNPPATPNAVVIPRSEFGTTRQGQAAAARAANTGTGTPFSVKGFPPNSTIRQGAELRVGGATLAVSADAIPTTTGALAIPLASPGLPGTYPDDTPFQLIRRDVRTLTLDGNQNAMSPVLRFRDLNTDGIIEGGGVNLASAVGGYTVTSGGPFGQITGAYVDRPLLAGRFAVTVTDSVGNQVLAWPTKDTDVYWLLSPQLSGVGLSSGQITFIGTSSLSPVVGTVVSYIGQGGRVAYVRVTAVAPGVLDVVPVGDGSVIVGWSGLGLFRACNVLIADGTTWTYTVIRETRTVRANGTQNAGALTLSCKPQANIATRQWVATDTISLTRDLSATLRVTGITSTAPFTDENGNPVLGMEAVVTFDAALSTIDDLTAGVDWSVGQVFFDLGTVGVWKLESLSGGSATLSNPDLSNTPTPFTVPQTATASWIRTDTYALTGTANWGTNGRVTLALASAVPTGRSYARGMPVGSNWVSGFLRLHAALTAGATTVELFGHDGFTDASTDPTASLRGAVYRVPASGSTVPIPGNTLYAAASAAVNGSGNASVTLTAANPNAIALDDAVVMVTPDLLRPSDARTGSAIRLTGPIGVGGPTTSSPGLVPLRGRRVVVPPGATVPIVALVTFSLSTGTYFQGQQPAVSLVDDTGTVLATAILVTGTAQVVQTPTIARLIVRHTLTATTTVFLRIHGGSSAPANWTVCLDAMLCVSDRDDIPFTPGSWANLLAIRGAEELAARRDPAVAVALDIATLRRWSDAPATTPVVVGQTVELPAYGLTRRVLSVQRSLTDPDRVRVEVGVPTDDLSTQVGTA